MNRYTIIIKNWIAYASIITLLCGIVYITVQQSYRHSANDPQFQVAEDAASAIGKGVEPKAVVGNGPSVELSESLAGFLVVYDAAGNIVAGNATLDGAPPKFPQGVLNNVQANGVDVLTWQPRSGVRQATVSVKAKGYIVVAGRSLRLTEERIAQLGKQVLFGWGLSLIGMLVISFLLEMIGERSLKYEAGSLK